MTSFYEIHWDICHSINGNLNVKYDKSEKKKGSIESQEEKLCFCVDMHVDDSCGGADGVVSL